MPGNPSAMRVTLTAPTVREGTDSHAVFTVAFDRATQVDTVFSVRTGEDTATTFGVDYGTATGTGLEISLDGGRTWTVVASKLVTIPAGATGALFRTPITDDRDVESDEIFGFSMIGVSGEVSTDFYADAHATIIDNDRPSLAVGNVTVTEGVDRYAVFNVALGSALPQRTAYNLSLQGGSAVHGKDFGSSTKLNDIQFSVDGGKTWSTAVSGNASVPAGVKGLLVRTAILDDQVFEQTESFGLTVKQLDGPGAGTQASGTATICDNDAPTLTVSNVSVVEGTDAWATFTVDLSRAKTEATTLDLKLLAGTAQGSGVDYGSASGGSLQVSTDGRNWVTANSGTIAAGSTRLYVRTAVVNDATREGSENFKLEATVTAGSTTNATAQGAATIVDDDTPCLSVNDITAYEGGYACFTVSLSRPATSDVTFHAYTVDGTGRAGKHYLAVDKMFTIPAGCTSIVVKTKLPSPDGDWVAQNFSLKVDNVCGCSVGDGVGTCTIKDTTSPLVLDLDGNGVQTVASSAGVSFDHDADGRRESTGWVDRHDGLLALDLDGNGLIDSGAELFGSHTRLADGMAPNGFAALAQHDGNGDGRIDAADAVFAQLRVWQDANGDGVSQADELRALSQHGIAVLDLGYVENMAVQAGNLFAQTGHVVMADGAEREMTDVWFGVGAPLEMGDVLDAAADRSLGTLGGAAARPLAEPAAGAVSRAELLFMQGLDFNGHARLEADLLEAARLQMAA